jgi:hypothetical protein
MRVPPQAVPAPATLSPSANENVIGSSSKLIIPLGAAIATLIANISCAAKVPVEAHLEPTEQEKSGKAPKPTDPVLERLAYRIGENAHTLTLHRAENGILYAGHGSHRSHSSHRSHRSGR